jgi:hypothetical protein
VSVRYLEILRESDMTARVKLGLRRAVEVAASGSGIDKETEGEQADGYEDERIAQNVVEAAIWISRVDAVGEGRYEFDPVAGPPLSLVPPCGALELSWPSAHAA